MNGNEYIVFHPHNTLFDRDCENSIVIEVLDPTIIENLYDKTDNADNPYYLGKYRSDAIYYLGSSVYSLDMLHDPSIMNRIFSTWNHRLVEKLKILRLSYQGVSKEHISTITAL